MPSTNVSIRFVQRGILAAAKRQSIRDHFIWIASDGWGRQHKLVEGLEDVAEGALTVDLQSNEVPGFDDYMLSLTPYNNGRNLWYGEFWQEIFGCLLSHNVDTGLLQSTTGGLANVTVCSPNLRLTRYGYEQDTKIQFVIDAVYAFAHALDALQRDVCDGLKGPCPALLAYDGGDFYSKYLLNVSFTGGCIFGPSSLVHRGSLLNTGLLLTTFHWVAKKNIEPINRLTRIQVLLGQKILLDLSLSLSDHSSCEITSHDLYRTGLAIDYLDAIRRGLLHKC